MHVGHPVVRFLGASMSASLRRCALVLSLLASLAFAPSAMAGTVTQSTTELTFTATGGDVDHLSVVQISPTEIRFDDSALAVTTGAANCSAAAGNVTCTVQ